MKKPKTIPTMVQRRKVVQALIKIADALDAQMGDTVLTDTMLSQLPTIDTQPAVLGTSDAANYLGVATKTLAMWRWKGVGGPLFLKHGSKVVYRRSDLSAFLQGAQRSSTSQRLD